MLLSPLLGWQCPSWLISVMSTYAIGDVQGCLQPLIALLDKVNYDRKKDTLWFAGDLINRGPKSLETLDFITKLPKSTVVVLGNHDLSLMASYAGARELKQGDTFKDILKSNQAEFYINWLRNKPLIHHDKKLGYTITHAGILPSWDLDTAIRLATEVENLLKSTKYSDLLKNMYGKKTEFWSENLSGWERTRFIINAFTIMRYCTTEGHLCWENKGPPNKNNGPNIPWYNVETRATKNDRILFGHWSALNGESNTDNVFALDTGCVWGNTLTAQCLETGQRFCAPNKNLTVKN
jgi:bis(5'-nucleosyl)-tetraphosphatase (symmetrical)